MLTLCLRTGALQSRRGTVPAFACLQCSRPNPRYSTTRLHSSTDTDTDTNDNTEVVSTTSTQTDGAGGEGEDGKFIPPWSMPAMKEPSSKSFSRFRQHVNPLARRYQMQADLPNNWPYSDYTNVNSPLYLDIGCGKGGFLLELVGRRHGYNMNDGDDSYMNTTKTLMEDTTNDWLPATMNYLGLEIRPGVSQYAQSRVEKRGLDGLLSFVGCNANVDLDRLLTLYQESAKTDNDKEGNDNNNRLAFVSIQYPDPHFKKAHSKRRVVTPQLVTTLAKFMKEGDVVFLQSDVLDALEDMRERFVEDDGKVYFDEQQQQQQSVDNEEEGQEYGIENPLGIPTEREVSVLKKGLPVYRTLFKRNGVAFE